MRFIDREELVQTFKGKRVAIIGSGPGSLDNPHGFVDSHDVVLRCNNYKLIPGSGTGLRTDVHFSFYGNSIKKSALELQRDGVKLCINKCPNAKVMESEWHRRRNKMSGVDFRYIYQIRERWWFGDTYVPPVAEFMESFELLGNHVPTTGFAAVLQVLSCQPSNCFVSGLDFFQTAVHNVNEAWKPGHPGDPIGHVPHIEREWFIANIERLPVTMDALLSQAVSGSVAPRMAPARRPRPRVFMRRKIGRAIPA